MLAEFRQIVLTAHLDGNVIGFMSLLQDGSRLMQCHGGLDYQRSHEVKVYEWINAGPAVEMRNVPNACAAFTRMPPLLSLSKALS